MKKQKRKKAQIPTFAWIFSIIVGAVFLFLAFFFVTQYGKKVAEPERGAIVESGISILTEPFLAVGSLVEAKSSILEFPANTHVEFDCNIDKDSSVIKAKGVKEKTFSLVKNVHEKYIFSDTIITKSKENFFAFTMPMKQPFYIVTPIVIVTQNYCLVDFPYQYQTELERISGDINKAKYRFNFTEAACPSGYTSITLQNLGCMAGCEYGIVGSKYWFGNLIYPAVFTSEEVYNCNLDRILERMKILATLHMEKVKLLSNSGCSAGDLLNKLNSLVSAINDFKQDKNGNTLGRLYSTIKAVENANQALDINCRPF